MTMVGTLSQVNANSGYVDGGELTAQNGKEFSVVLKMQDVYKRQPPDSP